MTPESWQRVQKILDEALTLGWDDRPKFLDSACGDDPDLRKEVESLLDVSDEAGAFIEEPVLSLRPDAVETRVEASSSPSLPSPGTGRKGDLIGHYKILRELGRGGMGKVLLASRADDEFEREVAIKVLQRGKDSDEIVRRFRHERQILANLAHPNIAELFDGGTTENGLPYFVLEYVEGVRIDDYCDDRRLSIRQRLELFRKVCSAVHFAHQSLVVHRDLKPGNILVTADGEPKLLDFGIAKLLPTEVSPTDTTVDRLTESGIEPMTPDYASPEQIQGEAITTASDVYSLGVLLYRLLCGHGPYRLDNRAVGKLFKAIVEVEPYRPSSAVLEGPAGQAKEISAARGLEPQSLKRRLAGDLDAIVLKALRKKPRERYGSVEQLSEDIRRHLERLPVVARQGTLFYQTSKFLRRHSVALGAAAAVLLMVFFGVRSMILANQTKREKQVTQSLSTLFQRLQKLQPRDVEKPGFEADLISEVRKNVDDLKLATILNEQAKFLENQGGFATAEVLYREALAMVVRLFGDIDDANIAIIKNNLAAAMEAQGEYGEAEKLLRETLEIRIAVFGRESYETTIALNNLGVLLQNKGDLDAAEPYLLESLEIRRRLFDAKAPQMGLVLNNYGFYLQARGDYPAAESYYRETLSIFRTHFGLEHPSVGTVLRNLAALLTLTGDLDNAERLSRQALEIFNRSYFKHWKVADAESVAGGTLVALGRHDEAEPLLRHSYTVLSTTKGSNARQTKEALARLESLEEAMRSGL